MNNSTDGWWEGTKVVHPIWGEGLVVSLEETTAGVENSIRIKNQPDGYHNINGLHCSGTYKDLQNAGWRKV